MITMEAFWKGRDVQFPGELTDEILANAQTTVGRTNELLASAGFDHIDTVNSGWRPRAVNDATSNAAAGSKHLSGQAIDLPDPDRALAHWCFSNQSVLVDI